MLVRLLITALVAGLALPQVVYTQNQVTPAELQRAILNATQTRQRNLEQVRSFFSSDAVRSALKTVNVDPNRLEQKVSTLNSDELTRLASRTQAIQSDFAAGALSNQELTYVVIAIAAAVLVLIVVAA
jgi:hypothetical protein